jgi:hypothetical protein
LKDYNFLEAIILPTSYLWLTCLLKIKNKIMILNRKFILEGASQQKFTVDLSYSESQEQKVIIFCHGFKGFKDWGVGNWSQTIS